MPPPPPRVPVAQQGTGVHAMQETPSMQKTGNLQQSTQESDTDKLEGSGIGPMTDGIGAKLAQATL